MTATSGSELLDVVEAFVGYLHCGAQNAGIEALLAADLTFSQMRTLLTLVQHPEPTPINEIAGRLGLSVAAAGRNVDQLVRTGLVDRVEDGLDRRIKRISLSGAGFELIASFKDGQRRFALDLLAGVDEHDARRLIDAFGPHLRNSSAIRSIDELRDRPEQEWGDVPEHFSYQYQLFPNTSLTFDSRHVELWQILPVDVDRSEVLHTAYLRPGLSDADRRSSSTWRRGSARRSSTAKTSGSRAAPSPASAPACSTPSCSAATNPRPNTCTTGSRPRSPRHAKPNPPQSSAVRERCGDERAERASARQERTAARRVSRLAASDE